MTAIIKVTDMKPLEGKVGLVAGVANKRSIAWAIAQAWHEAGAELVFTYQGDRLKGNVEQLASTFGADTLMVPCDVSSDEEIDQGNVIIDTIISSIKILGNHNIGLCFPGLNNRDGIVVMANGPRIPNLSHHIKSVKTILNDSDCCVLGELKSTIGMMQNTKNGVYIGGGTGIADGIIINSKLLTLNSLEHIPRSWEISLGFNETVETLLSPAGMVKKYNDQNNTEIKVLAELIHKKEFNKIMDDALKAFFRSVNA